MNIQWSNIVNLLTYMGIAIPLLWIGIYIFRYTTPYDEFEILREGGDVSDERHVDAAMAVAYDIGGKVLGVAIVLASAVFHAVNPLELAIWGVIGIILEVLVFCLFRLIAPVRVIEEIPGGNISVGVFSASMSISSGLIMASLIS